MEIMQTDHNNIMKRIASLVNNFIFYIYLQALQGTLDIFCSPHHLRYREKGEQKIKTMVFCFRTKRSGVVSP